MSAPENHEDTIHEPLAVAKSRFLDSLGDEPQLQRLFQEATLENMISSATNIEREDHISGARSLGRRLQPLITAVTDLAEGFDTFANTTPLILAPIWGSIRVVLVIARKYRKFYDRIVDTLNHVGDVLPRLRDYKRTFDQVKHSRLTNAISLTFADIIILCLEIKSIISLQQKSTFQRLWKPLSISVNKQLEDAVERFRRHKLTVEAEAFTAHMIEEADARALALRNTALRETTRKAELRSRLLSSLSRLNPATKHHKLRKKCHPDTGMWLLRCDSYKAWLNCPGSSTFCLYGIPGCGKSILAMTVIEKLRMCETLNLSYHYCDYSDKRSLEPVNILGSLARALLETIEIPKAVADDIESFYQDGSRTPDVDEVFQILSAVAKIFVNVILVVDGLNELEEQDRSCISRSLKDLLSTCKIIRLFITSRDNAAFSFATNSSSEFREHASSEALSTDIDAFVRHSMRALLDAGSLKIFDSQLEETIVDALVHGAKGMFLWVQYQLEDLCAAATDEAILEVLGNLPDGLGETYDRLLHRISGSRRQDLIKRMFQWIICSRRPLSLFELSQGIAFTLEDQQWDAKKIPTDMPRLIRSCGNVVVVDEETAVVEFAHYTLQQYILQEVDVTSSSFHFSLAEANEVVGDTLLAYLCFSDFETQIITRPVDNLVGNMAVIEHAVTTGSIISHDTIGRNAIKIWKSLYEPQVSHSSIDFSKFLHLNQPLSRTETLSTKFSLLEYAVDHWLSHTAGLFPELRGILANMEEDSMTQVLTEAKRLLRDSSVGHRRYTLFVKLAFRKRLMVEIRPWRLAPRTSRELSNLSLIGWALEHNHLPLLCLSSIHDSSIKPWNLIEDAGRHIFTNAENTRVTKHMREDLISISHKVPNDEIHVLKWLYSKLLNTCRQGFLDILPVLIPPTSRLEFPLSHIRGHLVFEAVAAGHNEIVAYLCDNKLPVEIGSSYQQYTCNALDLAAIRGDVEMVQTLREYGFRAPSVLPKGNFLSEAVETGNENGVEAILEAFKSVPPTRGDNNIQQQEIRALRKACSQISFKIIQLLLDNGVDPTLPDGDGYSAMVSAVISSQYEIVKLMLDYGYGAAGFYGSNVEAAPILWAAAIGNRELTTLLMDYGAEVLPTSLRFWHSPLFVAAANGHSSLIDLFSKVINDLKQQDLSNLDMMYEPEVHHKIPKNIRNGLTSMPSLFMPLLAAKINGHTETAIALQEACPCLDLLDIYEKPSFLEEAFWDYPPILKLLIATRKFPDSLSFSGDTLLTFATASGQKIAVQSLIEAGADVNLPNLRGQTPLSLAVQRTKFFTELTRILLEAGAKPKIDDLLVALDRREHEVLEALLAHGADTEARTYGKLCMLLSSTMPKGATPLIIAARGGDNRAVRLLLKAGADAEATDEPNLRTALYHAQLTKNVECASILEDLKLNSHKSQVGKQREGFLMELVREETRGST